MSSLFSIWHSIQHTLFPWLENELDPLTEKQREFVRVIELAEVQKHMSPYRWQGIYLFKKNFCWIWGTVDRHGKRFIDCVLGDRGTATGKQLWDAI